MADGVTAANIAKLYTMDDCAYCSMLKARLKFEGVQYEEINDKNIIHELSFDTVPQLEVNGNTMDFYKSISWLNQDKHKVTEK